jgi:hypothetical protein
MATITPVSRLLILVIVTLLFLVACGGGASEEEFQQDVVDARDRVDAGLAQVTTAGDFEELLDRLEIAAVETRKAATDLGNADSPGSLRDEKRELTEALRTLSLEIVGTVETFDTLGPNVPITRGINFEAWDVVQGELADLRDAGINVRPLGRHGGATTG